ncbi:hypothetical protein [Mycoplasma struthionis]|uniref:Variable surface lipoprotein n=1 Tax=Mycoplasma struthionis TaxID=538220 RepID=A0A3G8LGG8_9MOLU|nr:hypothetical protein [Mycoplasma struthionis]AZG68783.1 hypothetical protein EGN60_02335 [Mycoplasma struthionis]
MKLSKSMLIKSSVLVSVLVTPLVAISCNFNAQQKSPNENKSLIGRGSLSKGSGILLTPSQLDQIKKQFSFSLTESGAEMPMKEINKVVTKLINQYGSNEKNSVYSMTRNKEFKKYFSLALPEIKKSVHLIILI